ncbi:MAG: hypothetical protein CMJ96_05595 [Planctomycetes bacterium]|nr:hypothetical protein [Planctomycetota bacterium]MDP6128761.1 hypothetical protein [Planctomycetota bacterium]MDP7246076.1 hypothetical protein [Planctomycetota bacterium]|tara:strand:- start:5030 stop:6568 length:1539 start_codon:yes stop_codon:yes gene_type:complete
MATRTSALAHFLLNNWRNSHSIAEALYESPADVKKLRAARQALSRLRDALQSDQLPLDVPAGRTLVLDERWERKKEGQGSEKCFRLRMQDSHAKQVSSTGLQQASWLQLWAPPSSWTGWIVSGFQTLERDRSISHKHLYTALSGPDNWLTVAGSPVYKHAERCSGEAVYSELHSPSKDWVTRSVIYLGLGTGSGMADIQVVRELLENDRSRTVRAVLMDFSPVLLMETVANFNQEFVDEIAAGRLLLFPILGDLEQPQDWVNLLPTIESQSSLLVGMFGNTIGHLQYRERATIQNIFEQLNRWATQHGAPEWTLRNSRMLLGISLQRMGGAPHGQTKESSRRWLNLVTDPLRTLLERSEGEYITKFHQPDEWVEEEGRTSLAELCLRDGEERIVGRFLHERLPYKPSDGLTGVVQRYIFAFDCDLELRGEEVFQRHHLPESRWSSQASLKARFSSGGDEVVLCEVTQFKLNSFRPALRRLGMAHGESQVYKVKVGNTTPYAVLAFAPNPTQA